MSGTDWQDYENDLVVSAYVTMLTAELSNQPINKTATYRELALAMPRSAKAIELKFQNVSAVLAGMGHVWVSGLKPRAHFQHSLIDAVARSVDTQALPTPSLFPQVGFAEPQQLYLEAPPTLSNAPPPAEAETYAAIAQRFDAAGRDARNRALGEAGEAHVLAYEQHVLREQKRPDLAEKVRWTSKEDGDGAGYDIASFTADGAPRLIEVKTTLGSWPRTPFHLTRNEWRVAEKRADHWRLFRVYDFGRRPRAFELAPPLARHVELTATQYRATFP